MGYGAKEAAQIAECFEGFVEHQLQNELRVVEWNPKGRRKGGYGWASGLDQRVMSEVLGHPQCYAAFLKVLCSPMVIVRSLVCIGVPLGLG